MSIKYMIFILNLSFTRSISLAFLFVFRSRTEDLQSQRRIIIEWNISKYTLDRIFRQVIAIHHSQTGKGGKHKQIKTWRQIKKKFITSSYHFLNRYFPSDFFLKFFFLQFFSLYSSSLSSSSSSSSVVFSEAQRSTYFLISLTKSQEKTYQNWIYLNSNQAHFIFYSLQIFLNFVVAGIQASRRK